MTKCAHEETECKTIGIANSSLYAVLNCCITRLYFATFS